MVTLHEILSPAVAVPGPVFKILMSDDATRRKVVPVLFSVLGSGVVAVTVTLFWYSVPLELGGIWATRVKEALVFASIDASVQVTVPPEPTAGVMQLNV
jgi:hypothetical protein